MFVVTSAFATKEEVDKLYTEAIKFVKTNPDSSIALANSMLELTDGYDHGVVKSYYMMGRSYLYQKKYDNAALYYFEALKNLIDKTDSLSLNIKQKISTDLGYVYEMTYMYDFSKEYYTEALNIAISLNNKRAITKALYNIGVVYRKLDSLEIAKEYFLKCAFSTDDKYYLGKAYNNIGVVMDLTENFDSARFFYFKALNNDSSLYYIANIGESFYLSGEPEKAIVYYNKALIRVNTNEDIHWLTNNIAQAYFDIKEYDKAEAIIQHHLSDNYEEVFNSHVLLANIYEATRDFEKANHYNKMVRVHSEEVKESSDELIRQNSKYRMQIAQYYIDLKNKEAKIAEQKVKTLVVMGMAVIFGILTILYGYWYFFAKGKLNKIKSIIILP